MHQPAPHSRQTTDCHVSQRALLHGRQTIDHYVHESQCVHALQSNPSMHARRRLSASIISRPTQFPVQCMYVCTYCTYICVCVVDEMLSSTCTCTSSQFAELEITIKAKTCLHTECLVNDYHAICCAMEIVGATMSAKLGVRMLHTLLSTVERLVTLPIQALRTH